MQIEFPQDPGARCPHIVRMVVEIPKLSGNKYEYDPDLKIFKVSRALYSPMYYPGDYGFIPGTIAEDNDPLDILALVPSPSFPGCLYEVRPLGVLDLVDEDECDHKILAVPEREPRSVTMRDLDSVDKHRVREIEHFFRIYKELEQKQSHIRGWGNADAAKEIIMSSRKRFLDKTTNENAQLARG